MVNLASLMMDEILAPESDDSMTEVVFAADESAGAHPEASMHDLKKLEEEIQRYKAHLRSSLSLPDGGEKLRNTIARLKDEFKRKSGSICDQSKKDNKACRSTSKCTTSGPFDWIDDTDTFYCESYKKYLPLPTNNFYNKGGCAFTKELNLFGGQKHKITEKKYQLDNNNNSKKQPSRSFSPKGRSLGYEKINVNCTFGKRRKIKKIQDLSDSDITEVSHVVLSDDDDDDDVQTIDPPIKDIPEKWKECKMYYPSRNDSEAVELTYSNIKCLEPFEYLSSPIMNFYIQYLKRSVSRDSNRSFYIFNTYFYQKLENAFNGKGNHDSIFTRLRRWWKGVNIFEKSYIIMPIHGSEHWSLVIICIPAKESKSGPFILHLDSLTCHSSHVIFHTIEWYFLYIIAIFIIKGNLQESPCIAEFYKKALHYCQNCKKSTPFIRKEWKHAGQNSPKIFLNNFNKEKVEVPQQKNAYDCGLFVLYYIERFIREAPAIFTIDNLDMFHKKWFKSEEASGLRQRIRSLLIEELESARLEDANIESDTICDSSDSD